MVLSSISCFIFGLPFWLIKLIIVLIIILTLIGIIFMGIFMYKDPDFGSHIDHRKYSSFGKPVS